MLLAASCASNGKVTAEQAAPPKPDETEPAQAAQAAALAGAVLDGDGLGRVKLGAPLPPDLATAGRYYAGYYADAQPLEGFELGPAGVLAIVEGGAFTAFGNEHPGQPAPDDVRARTLASGAASALTVRMIVVTDPAVSTVSGVRVGTGIAAFRAALADAELKRYPPLWEDPTCLAEASGLAYFFDGCPASDAAPPAEGAKVVRIVARR
jgi:hypothetical protein